MNQDVNAINSIIHARIHIEFPDPGGQLMHLLVMDSRISVAQPCAPSRTYRDGAEVCLARRRLCQDLLGVF